jgi:2-polyprenyl-3-methyl-5-hydroxy-6-metoxy-1,4-benzoquinol methylase
MGLDMGKGRSEKDEKRLQETRQFWDDAAASFDAEPDHGLRDPGVREAWKTLLNQWLPPIYTTVLDMGCGTGSLSMVLAGLGREVTGIDLSSAMVKIAREKAIAMGLEVEFHLMDAAFPDLSPRKFDAMVCRHLLWDLPEPKQVLNRWAGLLKPKGRLLLVEGRWGTGAGLHADEIIQMLPAVFATPMVVNLSENPDYWGGNVDDERYAIIADLKK